VTSFIPEQTNKAILAVIDGLAKTVPAALLGTGTATTPPGLFKGLVGKERRFTDRSKKYILFVTSDTLLKAADDARKLLSRGGAVSWVTGCARWCYLSLLCAIISPMPRGMEACCVSFWGCSSRRWCSGPPRRRVDR
jgi:hypothetical protein